jgi:multidrug efflux system membrane fusion protein
MNPAARALACALLTALVACNRAGAPPRAPAPPPPVTVARASEGTVPITVRSVGAAEPIANVVLRPRIDGQIVELPAGEGVDVAQGAVLARLDTRTFDAALKQHEAELARDRAMAADAHRAAAEYADAALARASPQRTSEEAQAKAMALDASVLADEAAAQTARLNLEYCVITAPFPGRLGALSVKPGAVVKANETDLVELVQLAPIHVAFSIPEERLPQVQAGQKAAPLKVRVEIPGDAAGPVEGQVDFVDNRVESTTGSIRLKAVFANADRRLWPGQFLTVTLILGEQERAVLVPAEAVQTSQDGAAAFIVKDDQTVELRRLTVGRSAGRSTVIEAGISPGETVVTDGQLRLTSGMKVETRPAPSR